LIVIYIQLEKLCNIPPIFEISLKDYILL